MYTTTIKTAIIFRSAGFAVAVVFASAASPAKADIAEAWGSNTYGELGNGTTTSSSSPVVVTGMSSGVTAVAGGANHSVAVQNGGVYAWGENNDGQLGNGSLTNSSTPLIVSGSLSGVTAVTAGQFHSLAVMNGKVYAWGDNQYGELGNGSTTNSSMPLGVSVLTSGVTAIAAGAHHSLAVQSGEAYAWGYNIYGQLGNGTTTNSSTPAVVSGMSSGVTAIAGGTLDSLAIKNGAAYAWGFNEYGELGVGTTYLYSATPLAVSGLSSGVTAIAGGFDHSLAVKSGRVYSWGSNSNGQLGDGTTTNDFTPEQIDAAQLTNITAVCATASSSYALASDGSLWVWGDNTYGELGLGSATTDFLTPQHLLPPSNYFFTSVDAYSDGETVVATLATVPEPTTVSLLALGSVGLMRRCRRREKSTQNDAHEVQRVR